MTAGDPGATAPACEPVTAASTHGGQDIFDAVVTASRAAEIRNWDTLAAAHCFYQTASWLDFVDGDEQARPLYLAHPGRTGPEAALTAHWNPEESHADYLPAKLLGLASPVPGRLTVGGRRGFRSALLAARDERGASATGELLSAATALVPEARGQWWWPYLPSEDVPTVVAAARRASPDVGPQHIHVVGADCVIDVVGTGVESHVAALPDRQRRTNARRELRSLQDRGVELGHCRLSDVVEEAAPLLAQVQQKYGHAFTTEQARAFLHRQVEHLDAMSTVCTVRSGGTLLAFSLSYRSADELALRLVGRDYARSDASDVYAYVAVYGPLERCYEWGLRTLHLGTETYAAKIRRGARVRALWAVAPDLPADPTRETRTTQSLLARLPRREAETFGRGLATTREHVRRSTHHA